MITTRSTTVLITILVLLGTSAATAFAQAQLVYRQGEVTVRRGAQSFPADIGASLAQDDLVITGTSATAILMLNGNTQVKMREKTEFRIAGLGTDTTLDLKQGSLFTNIIGKLHGAFDIRTGGVLAGVRGTEFFVAYGKKVDSSRDVWLCVNRGVVNVSIEGTGQSVDVPAGKGVNILAGRTITSAKEYG